MKKGFTLVELAIVLVVIGLIMGMAVKGKTLIESAKTRSEIAKIKRIEQAIYTYEASKGRPLPLNQACFYHTHKLIDYGFLNPKDLKRRWSVGFNNGAIDNYSLQSYEIHDNKYRSDTNNALIGLTSGRDELKWSEITSLRTICAIEVYLDDGDVTSGDGRCFDEVLDPGCYNVEKKYLEGCESVPDKVGYAYLYAFK